MLRLNFKDNLNLKGNNVDHEFKVLMSRQVKQTNKQKTQTHIRTGNYLLFCSLLWEKPPVTKEDTTVNQDPGGSEERLTVQAPAEPQGQRRLRTKPNAGSNGQGHPGTFGALFLLFSSSPFPNQTEIRTFLKSEFQVTIGPRP